MYLRVGESELSLVGAHGDQLVVAHLVVVKSLEGIVIFEVIECVAEMLHELLVVDLAVKMDVSYERDKSALSSVKTEGLEFKEALGELLGVQEALLVFVELAEDAEQVQVLILGHLHNFGAELTELDQLSLSSECLHGVHALDKSLKLASEGTYIDSLVVIKVSMSNQVVDLVSEQGQLL